MPNPDLTILLAELREHYTKQLAICDAATPGPWNTQTCSYRVQSNAGGVGCFVAEMMSHTSCERDANATFIAHARTALPDAIRANLRMLDALEAAHDTFMEYGAVHMIKDPPQAEKATRNYNYAAKIETTLRELHAGMKEGK